MKLVEFLNQLLDETQKQIQRKILNSKLKNIFNPQSKIWI